MAFDFLICAAASCLPVHLSISWLNDSHKCISLKNSLSCTGFPNLTSPSAVINLRGPCMFCTIRSIQSELSTKHSCREMCGDSTVCRHFIVMNAGRLTN